MRERLLAYYKDQTQPGPLKGVIAIGFCYYVAGPIVLQTLVRQGALVIKIEGKPAGDPSRKVFSPSIFNSLTHGQLSVALDYKKEEDRHLLQELLNIADVIVDNRSVDARERDEVLQNYLASPNKQNDKIYCALGAFPNEKINKMPGLDASVQAITGFAYSNAPSFSEPLKVGVPILDITTGLLAANYIASNLFFLAKHKLPAETKNILSFSVSLAGTSFLLQANQIINALERNEYFRKGNQDKFAAPFSYYTTKNGLISIATVNENQFKIFCLEVLKNKDFYEKYPLVEKRIERQDEFEKDLNRLLKEKNKEDWLLECQAHRVPAAPVLTVSEATQQRFFNESLRFSANEKPIITDAISHSLFSPPKLGNAPAPEVDQDHEVLSSILSVPAPPKISAKL